MTLGNELCYQQEIVKNSCAPEASHHDEMIIILITCLLDNILML